VYREECFDLLTYLLTSLLQNRRLVFCHVDDTIALASPCVFQTMMCGCVVAFWRLVGRQNLVALVDVSGGADNHHVTNESAGRIEVASVVHVRGHDPDPDRAFLSWI
jgi:hypothetical protein